MVNLAIKSKNSTSQKNNYQKIKKTTWKKTSIGKELCSLIYEYSYKSIKLRSMTQLKIGQWMSIDISQERLIQISLKHISMFNFTQGKCKLNLDYIAL